MNRRASASCRHRAGVRRGVDGCEAAPGGRPWRPRRLALLFAVAVLGWPSHNLARAACSNGLEGVESSAGDVCCVEACGVCGGEGCGDIGDLDDMDCCTGDITKIGVVCGNGNTAPCIIDDSGYTAKTPSPVPGTSSPQSASSDDLVPTGSQAPTAAPQSPTLPTASPPPTASPLSPVTPLPTGAPARSSAPVSASVTTAPSTPPPGGVTSAPAVSPVAKPSLEASTCSNGFPGWQSNEACCSEFCGQCGGEGCGILGSADCCYDNIINANLVCGRDTSEAPCIISDSVSPSPILSVAPETLGPDSPTLTPAPADGPAAPVTEAPVSRGLPTTAPPAAPTPAPMPGTSAGATFSPGGTLAPPSATPSPEQDNTPPAETEVETCSNNLPGYQHGVVCCPLSCGQCGGSGCENIRGTEGGSDCCSDIILSGGADCDSTAVVPVVAPCIVGTVDEVERASEAANAATSLRKSGGVGGTVSATGVAYALAAAVAATAACFAH